MKKFVSLVVVLLVFLAGAAFAAPADKVLKLSTLAPLTTIDPHSSANIQDIMVFRQVFESVYYQNEKSGEYEPRIAESYEISPDGTVYTFKVRKNAKFHNGDALKASDCVFSFKRAMGIPAAKSRMVGVTDVALIDDYTFSIKLERPNAAFLNSLIQVFVVSEREVKEQGDKFGTLLTLAGTGPYFLTSLKHDVKWTCDAFPQYYRGEAKIKKLEYTPITEPAAGLIAFESGELDWYIAPIANWGDLTANNKYNTALIAANHISYIVINYFNKPLDDDNLRKAIAHAIDKEAMILACYDGHAVPADFMIQPENTGAPAEGIVYNHDIAKAKEYLAKSAYPKGTNVGTINCSAGGYFEKMAQVMQANLAEIGLVADIKRLDSATNLNNLRKQLFDMATTGMSPDGDYESWRRYVHTKAVGSYYVKFEGDKFDYKTMDKLWDDGVATNSLAERKAIYRKLNDMMSETATILPVFHKVQPYVWSKALNIPVNYPNYPVVYEWSWK